MFTWHLQCAAAVLALCVCICMAAMAACTYAMLFIFFGEAEIFLSLGRFLSHKLLHRVYNCDTHLQQMISQPLIENCWPPKKHVKYRQPHAIYAWYVFGHQFLLQIYYKKISALIKMKNVLMHTACFREDSLPAPTVNCVLCNFTP